MQSRTLARELALLILGQISDRASATAPSADTSLEVVLQQAQASLAEHVREALDRSADELRRAQQELLDSELQEAGGERLPRVRQHLQTGLGLGEQAINRLSASLELPRLLLLADQDGVRRDALARAAAVLRGRARIDRDILRLAVVDLETFATPPAVACNEAVELANRYSDEQGRRMINGVLRRFTTAKV
jgi:N utilization substance protein B